MSPNFNHLNVPSICVKIPMDEGDIRPDDIDEWWYLYCLDIM